MKSNIFSKYIKFIVNSCRIHASFATVEQGLDAEKTRFLAFEQIVTISRSVDVTFWTHQRIKDMMSGFEVDSGFIVENNSKKNDVDTSMFLIRCKYNKNVVYHQKRQYLCSPTQKLLYKHNFDHIHRN